MSHSPAFKASVAVVLLALLCLPFADLRIGTVDPWAELGRMAWGLLTPRFMAAPELLDALAKTVAFALLGVGLGAAAGFALALAFHRRAVRWGAAGLRSIHEIFWALLFMQALGLGAVTGVLAIALPYAGVFAKVFAEFLEEADPAPLRALPAGAGRLAGFFYGRLPGVWRLMRSYGSYRLECGLRSSAVLGFIGLPTLGFHLETFFRQGRYSHAAALLLLFYLLIATLRGWARPRLLLLYGAAALAFLWSPVDVSWDNAARFLLHDLLPYPLRAGPAPGALEALGAWLLRLLREQALPGLVATWLLAQIALAVTGGLTLLLFPLASRRFVGWGGQKLGHGLLVVLRSTPEFVLAYLFLQLWGPSMLPAILALALHNAGIIATLTGRHADSLPLRPDAPRGVNLYGYEILPRVYGQFLAFLFYRWEIILRETAILGILGVRTLGFYVDSAFAELRFDRALVLILATAALNIAVDSGSRALRARLRLSTRAGAA
jgi:phosphonate transport system permease protein